MKKLYKILILTLVILTATSVNMMAQAPPPPPPGHGTTGNQPGGNAPIGGGLFILLGLGAVYGGRKIFQLGKQSIEE